MAIPTPRSGNFVFPINDEDVPLIAPDEDFETVVAKAKRYIEKAVDTAYGYEQLRTTIAGHSLRPFVVSLSQDCHHPAIVAALIATRYAFQTHDDEDPSLTDSRSLACELIAFQFLTYLSERELIDHLLYELPEAKVNTDNEQASNASSNSETQPLLNMHEHEASPELLRPPRRPSTRVDQNTSTNPRRHTALEQTNLAQSFAGMNALEIAAVADAKKFLSQKPVQAVIEDIWNGNIIFWESLSSHAKKCPKLYNKRTADPFSRLRVPKYQKSFQIGFFAAFLVLYYAVLIQRSPAHVTSTEVLLFIWIAAFAYDEFGEIRDAGYLFYATDFWSIWDLMIILTGVAFFIARIVGLTRQDAYITDIAFDILSMLALFLVPRICSVASLNPYFGSLLPVLKEMTTAFCKFLPVICILYLGFLTTFTMLARDRLSLNEVSWLLIKVFFGSSYLGFEFAVQISPIFGYTLIIPVIEAPDHSSCISRKGKSTSSSIQGSCKRESTRCCMGQGHALLLKVIFVALTNILLLTALVSLVSNSLTEVMAQSRQEYLFQYSIYVLESCTSRRLTYFIPPTNLLPLLFVRPLRLILPSESVRSIRIMLLRAVSVPFVALIAIYEALYRLFWDGTAKQTLARMRSRPLSSGRLSYVRPSHVYASGIEPALRESTSLLPTDATQSLTQDPFISNGEDTKALLIMIQKLSVQVDELTTLIATQKSD